MKRVSHVLVVLTGLFCLLGPLSSHAVSYGSAVVDGNSNEWNFQTDFYASMHRAGNPDKKIESDLYLRYDCSTQTLYALVLTVPGVPGLPLVNDSWIKVGSQNGNAVDGNDPSFAWIGLSAGGQTVQGWEASFSLAPGVYTIAVHIQVWDEGESQTSATTSGTSNNRFIPLAIDCGGFQPQVIPVYDISGVAFVDDNRSGSLDLNEIGLIGVTVTLVDAIGNVLASIVTDANGEYLFENLPGGTYQVVVAPNYQDSIYEYVITSPSVVDVNLQADTVVDFGYIPVFDLGGVVFIDADRDTLFDSGEPGLQGYIIGLYDSNGALIATQVVGADGSYLFQDLPRGSYTVQVILVPAALNGFFVNTTPTSYAVELQSQDSLNNVFGYAPDAAAVLSEIGKTDTDGDGVVLSGTGKTIGFWKHQLTVAISRKGKAQVPAADLQVFVDGVEALLADQPFQFDDTNEFGSALKVLDSTSSNPVDLLKKQLLGTEFNQVSGRGLAAPYQPLQYALIAWGESLASGASTDAATLLTAKDIFDAINNTGE